MVLSLCFMQGTNDMHGASPYTDKNWPLSASLLIQMLISCTATFTNTLRNRVLPASRIPPNPAKLTPKNQVLRKVCYIITTASLITELPLDSTTQRV